MGTLALAVSQCKCNCLSITRRWDRATQYDDNDNSAYLYHAIVLQIYLEEEHPAQADINEDACIRNRNKYEGETDVVCEK